jgi:hypothetical protein
MIPRSTGKVAGMDTSHHRKSPSLPTCSSLTSLGRCGLLLLSQVVNGMAMTTTSMEEEERAQIDQTLISISAVIAQPAL